MIREIIMSEHDNNELSEAVEQVIETNPDTDSVALLGMLVDGVIDRDKHHPSEVREEIQRQLEQA